MAASYSTLLPPVPQAAILRPVLLMYNTMLHVPSSFLDTGTGMSSMSSEYVKYTARAVPYDAMDHHHHTTGRG